VVILRNPWPRLLGEVQRDATTLHAVRYQLEERPCLDPSQPSQQARDPAALAAEQEATPAVVCRNLPTPHEAPLNCGQLLISSMGFAEAVWEARPASFVNALMSQQGYANIIRHNFSHSGLPRDFFNHCWHAHKSAGMKDVCALSTYHATCEQDAKSKRAGMQRILRVVEGRNCSLSAKGDLSPPMLEFLRKAVPAVPAARGPHAARDAVRQASQAAAAAATTT